MEKKADKKTDKRVVKTKAHLKNALMELLKEKSLREISVKELTDAADINRGTFYIHYNDVYDVVNEIQTELFNELNTLIDTNHKKEDIMPVAVLMDIFKFVGKNSELCLLFLGPNGDKEFFDRLRGVVRERCISEWMEYYSENKPDLNPLNFGYYYTFIVAGCSDLLKQWLETGMKEPPEKMASLAGQMVLHGVKVLY